MTLKTAMTRSSGRRHLRHPTVKSALGVTRTMAGLGKRIPESGQLAESVKFNPPLSLFLPVRSRRSPEGSLHFDPVATQNSGDLAGLIASDGFIELPAEQNEFSVGFSAPFYPW